MSEQSHHEISRSTSANRRSAIVPRRRARELDRKADDRDDGCAPPVRQRGPPTAIAVVSGECGGLGVGHRLTDHRLRSVALSTSGSSSLPVVCSSFVMWVVAQGWIGDIFSGSGTDPNTGPLIIVLALAMTPAFVAAPYVGRIPLAEAWRRRAHGSGSV